MTETDLIEGLRKQSPKAQQETIDRYGREVFALVARLVGVALRIMLTAAAVYLVGLFLWLQQEPTEPVRLANRQQPVQQQTVVPCTEGTPDEIIMCYLEQRETRPNTYHLIRQTLYENKQ